MRNIRQNLFFAFVYNGLGVPVAGLCTKTRSDPSTEAATDHLRI
jgi:cation transport ATPase